MSTEGWFTSFRTTSNLGLFLSRTKSKITLSLVVITHPAWRRRSRAKSRSWFSLEEQQSATM
ncbi:hypothetical protein M5D96_007595 [Drosophila gunungcola]|uniref:Uncharacterized protein n=1 Tax=Drosophila gunungcola TaxID=103775 RepID=A0A9P9YN99_9MUSC|nr:hypothetical protein M5D96_007595 [Drosophila gunungcola]